MAKMELKRSIKSKQLKSGLLCIDIDGTGTPVASGPDGFSVASIVDLGVGNYTVILSENYEQDLHMVGAVCSTAAAVTVTAVAGDRVTILVVNSAGAPLDDAKISITLATFDNRFLY